MKSEFGDRETIGSMLANTHEEHIKNAPIEAHDLSREMGKSYMKGLFDNMEQNSGRIDRYYISVKSRKTKIYRERAIEHFYFSHEVLPPMEENQDVWFVDYESQKLELLWSLPERSEFDMILNEDKPDPQLVKWITIFKNGTQT